MWAELQFLSHPSVLLVVLIHIRDLKMTRKCYQTSNCSLSLLFWQLFLASIDSRSGEDDLLVANEEIENGWLVILRDPNFHHDSIHDRRRTVVESYKYSWHLPLALSTFFMRKGDPR